MNFSQSHFDGGVYFKTTDHGFIVVCVYVDDFLVASKEVKDTSSLYEGLSKKYKLTSKGEITEILNMKVERNAEGLTIYQERNINEEVAKFNLETNKDDVGRI